LVILPRQAEVAGAGRLAKEVDPLKWLSLFCVYVKKTILFFHMVVTALYRNIQRLLLPEIHSTET